MCFETTCNEMRETSYISILSVRPSTSTDQRFSTLDTRFSRFSRHFLASFLKGVNCRSLHRSLCPSSLFKNSTLADKIQFAFTSSPCTISSSFWWYTAGENIDTYGGTSQQQQVKRKPLLSSWVVLYVRVS